MGPHGSFLKGTLLWGIKGLIFYAPQGVKIFTTIKHGKESHSTNETSESSLKNALGYD